MKKIKIKEEEILNELIKIIYTDLIKKNYISKKYCNTDLRSNDLSKSSEIKEKFNTLLIPVYEIFKNLPYTMSLGEEELDMTHTKPKRYSLTLNGKIDIEEVKVWKEFYIEILEKLDENYSDKLKELLEKVPFEKSNKKKARKKPHNFMSFDKKVAEKKDRKKINDIYYSTHFNTNDFLGNLRYLFKELGIDFKNLEIEYSFEKLEREKLI